MKTKDILTAFNVELDKNAANIGISGCPAFLQSEKAYWINKAYNQLILRKVTGNNTLQTGFEGSVKRIFDLEKLKDMVMRNRKVMEVNKDPYKMSPVKFLQNKQNGIPVVKSDQALIERLCKEFQFPIEVVNTLIEYTLQQTNQQFSRNYVEKVAASWVRLGVDSRKKALDIINY